MHTSARQPCNQEGRGIDFRGRYGTEPDNKNENSVWQGNPGASPDVAEVTQKKFGRHLRYEWAELRQVEYWDKEVYVFF